MSWSAEQVLSLAPDDKSVKAGRSQASASKWSGTGQNDRALWGLCQGSGKKPYYTIVDLSEPAFKCSCPSRKFPCKHGLGLMLLWVDSPGNFPTKETDEWAADWITGRDNRSEKKEAKRADAIAGVVDPKAVAAAEKRAAKREDHVLAGIDHLQLWMKDLVRHGLTQAESRTNAEWDELARRLVDAQAPGLAQIIRDMSSLVGSGAGWHMLMLERIANLHTIVQSYKSREGFSEDIQEELKTLVGWNKSVEDVLRVGAVRDKWKVVGFTVEDEDNVRARRTWMRGSQTGNWALQIDYSVKNQAQASAPAVGHVIDADLHYYPSAFPMRAVFSKTHEKSQSFEDGLGDAFTVEQAYVQRATTLAQNPWITHLPVLVKAVPVRDDGSWWLQDASEDGLPIADSFDHVFELTALCGGKPHDIACQWTDQGLTPLAVLVGGKLETIA